MTHQKLTPFNPVNYLMKSEWAYITKTSIRSSHGVFVAYKFDTATTLERFVKSAKSLISKDNRMIKKELVFAVQCPDCKLLKTLVFERFKHKVFSWFDVRNDIRGLTEDDVFTIKRIASEHGEIWDSYTLRLLTELVNPN